MTTPPITGLHHVALCVHDLEATTRFYVDVIGLRQVHRPALPQEGVWLVVPGPTEQMVHLMDTGEDPPTSFQHFALGCDDLEVAARALASRGYELSDPQDVPGYGRQAFVHDPDGNLVELNEALRT